MNRSILEARLAGLAACAMILAACGDSNDGPTGQPPAAPAGLVATAANGAVGLTWTATSGATSYSAYRATSTGALSTKTKVGTSTSPAYNDTTATNGVEYFYQVTASNSAGESAGSTEASATPSATLPPVSPTGVTATAAPTQVTVTWSSVPGATSYNVYWSTSSPVTTGDATITVVSSPCQHLSLTNGTTYYYAVTAENAFGESALSAEVSATPSVVLPAPFIDATVIRWGTGMPGGVPIQQVRVCTDSSCSTAVSNATVTVNATTLTWDGARHEYVGNVMPAIGSTSTLTVTIPAGGAVAAGSYTATGANYSTAPTLTMPTAATSWSRAVPHDVTWTAGAPTSTTPASVYVVGIADGSGNFYPVKADSGPTEVAISNNSFRLPANTLPAAGTYIAFIGIGTTGIVEAATGGIPISGATADSFFHIGFVSATTYFTVTN